MAHQEHHDHAHHHAHSHAAANKAHFDVQAGEYDNTPGAIEMTANQVAAINKVYPALLNENTTVLDFACGTGLISEHIAPRVHSVLGVDISDAMVEKYNARATKLRLGPEKMRGIVAELKGNEEELEGRKFDVVVCTSAYHHMTSIEEVTRMLTFFLKPGGSLLVSDLYQNSNYAAAFSQPELRDIVAHKGGFHEDTMRKTFEGAGLVDFEMGFAASAILHDVKTDWFLARGVKPTVA
ncbi:S-adenosyl-L-methionine-dependent methyltransferase [Wolfiporia cocos MD-104 SS10]|uniref:S-adenosyl-L-methionine-dependent methyltransferase n=1 Tax=Wolfiporia cocos (strain MD-104) TaxID=742152 RepID=A0A2H3JDZ2_WOLCO|nr:S-adenosyl-L-methionine-dependent methyltransferase [Wolfiporia cocos MD-104 SS10]